MEARKKIDNIYMKWLEDYIDKNGEVTTENIVGNNKELLYIEQLRCLYQLLDRYAKVYGKVPIVDNNGSHYLLMYHDSLYDIGFETGENSGVYAFTSYDSIPNAIIDWCDMENYLKAIKPAALSLERVK